MWKSISHIVLIRLVPHRDKASFKKDVDVLELKRKVYKKCCCDFVVTRGNVENEGRIAVF